MLVPGAADGDRVALMRVRAEMIDRLVNEAGEVSIARSRIEGLTAFYLHIFQSSSADVIRLMANGNGISSYIDGDAM